MSHETHAEKLVELESLDTAFAVRQDEEGPTRRRLMTLLADPTPVNGRRGQCEVLRVRNTEGETFALKRLRPLPSDADPYSRRGREAALFEEYRTQLAVSYARGFPRPLGFGFERASGPVILMEWVEGHTLLDALPELPHDPAAEGSPAGCSARAVAAVASSLLGTLVDVSHLEGTFVHRDISPRNVMLRTQDADLDAQVASGRMETCLIDLGSAVLLRRDEASFTMMTDVWRNATPEYAPPEMLAPRDSVALEARRSPTIDVYALCSVLWQLYAGTTPYRLSERPGASAWELKRRPPEEALVARSESDRGLVLAIASGVVPEATKRPSAQALLQAVRGWQRSNGLAPADDAAMDTLPTTYGVARPDSGTHLGPLGAASGARVPRVADGSSPALEDPAPLAGPDCPDSAEAPRIRAGNGRISGSGARVEAPETGARHRLSRRALLGLAVGAVGAAALGGAAVATGGFGILRPRTFADLSWEELSSLSQRISAATSEGEALDLAHSANLLDDERNLREDLVHDVTLADGGAASVQLVDVYHDDRSDGRGKAGLTFAFAQPVARRAMADERMQTGGWETCDARGWLASELWDLLPDELASRIVAVDKLTNNLGATQSAASVTKTSDRLWLFSMVELGGTRGRETFGSGYGYLADVLNAEGAQYRLWSQQGVTARSSNEELVREYEGRSTQWWLRTPSPDVSLEAGATWFNRVGANGDPFHFAAEASDDTEGSTLLPGFCL